MEIFPALMKLLSDYDYGITVLLGFPTKIVVDLSILFGIQDKCLLEVVCTEGNVTLQLEPKDGVKDLLQFLNVELQEDLTNGKIENIITAVGRFFNPSDHSSRSSSPESKTGNESADSQSRPIIYPSHYRTLFEEENQLGKGGFGTVFRCKHKLDEGTYAIKKIAFGDEQLDKIIREVKIMTALQHSHVIRYYQCWIEDGCDIPNSEDSVELMPLNSSSIGVGETEISAIASESGFMTKTMYICMEFCPGKLEDAAKGIGGEKAWRFYRQIIEALRFIHGRGIIHGDLSLQNILLDCDENIKIADFGLAIWSDGVIFWFPMKMLAALPI